MIILDLESAARMAREGNWAESGLTDRQFEIYFVILRHFLRTGSMPTIRELGLATGISSVNGVVCHITALTKKRWLFRREDRQLVAARGTLLSGTRTLLEVFPAEDIDSNRRLLDRMVGVGLISGLRARLDGLERGDEPEGNP